MNDEMRKSAQIKVQKKLCFLITFYNNIYVGS